MRVTSIIFLYFLSTYLYLSSSYLPLTFCSFFCHRYVNHSCAPNCVAEVVTFDKEDKIIIISSRRIPKGEEVSAVETQHGTSSLGSKEVNLLPNTVATGFQILHSEKKGLDVY